MIPKATENTISALLSTELEKRKVRAQPFSSVKTPKGRREVDVWCANGGTYPVEAKFSRREIVKALGKVSDDYLKYRKILGIQGAFTLLYPDELTRPMDSELVKKLAHKLEFETIAIFPPEDARRNFTTCRGKLSEIADFLARNILTPPERIEPDIKFIIKVLRESAQYIVTGLRSLSGIELEDLFGGEDVFKNILQYFEKEKYPVENLRLAAGYILVNQLLFYHILSKRKPNDFSEIDVDNIEQPADLKKYFTKVLKVNYRSILSCDVASRIPKKYIDAVKGIIGVINCLSPEKVGGDLLGTIFHDLVPFETRKNVATFYTNVLAAELLAYLAIDRHDAKVADLAVGSGGLLVAAYRKKKDILLDRAKHFTQEDHGGFVERDLFGVDVMPFAANVAACHLALQSPEFFTDKVQIAVWDSTDLSPSAKIPSIADLSKVLKGQLTVDMFKAGPPVKGVIGLKRRWGKEIMARSYDVVIMNPPFTRQERLPPDYKKILLDRFKKHRDYLHGQLGYYGYFVLLADRFVHAGGRMALVLPATVLRVKSCGGIRRLWAGNYHVEHMITTWHRSAFSESTRFREILLVAKKGKPDPKAKTVVTVVKVLPTTLEEARAMAEAIQKSKSDWEDWRLAVKVYDYSELKEDTDNWFKYIATSDLSLIDVARKLLTSEKLATFEFEAVEGVESRRGGKVQALTISRPERAIKQSDEWVIKERQEHMIKAENRATHLRVEIPLSALSPALRRVSLVNRMDLSGMTDYVLVDGFRGLDNFISGTLTRFKPPVGFWNKWKSYVKERTGQLIIVRRTDLSAPGTSLLAFYSQEAVAPPGVAWLIKVGDDEAKILSLWFNSSINILQILLNRKETRGAFMQVDEYVLKKFRVPDLKKLSRDEVKSLMRVFESVKDVEFPDILHQLKTKYQARMEIDKAFLKVLGYKGDVDSLLERLYESLTHEIETLKELMKEATD